MRRLRKIARVAAILAIVLLLVLGIVNIAKKEVLADPTWPQDRSVREEEEEYPEKIQDVIPLCGDPTWPQD